MILLALLGLTFVSGADARPGDLIATYGQGGVSAPSLPAGTTQTPSDLAVLADGSTMVVGESEPGPKTLVAKYRVDGALDSSFGTGGVVSGVTGRWDRVVVQPDGKIVLSGSRGGLAVVARFNGDGSLDAGFGSGGTVLFDPTPLLEAGSNQLTEVEFAELDVLGDGRIRGIGTFFDCPESYSPGCSNAMAFSLTSAGLPDPGFAGPSGFVLLPQVGNQIAGVFLDDGSALIARDANGEYSRFGLPLESSRLAPDGTPDPGYGGTWSRDFVNVQLEGSRGAAVADSQGGLIVAAGSILVRFGPDGEPDMGFGDGKWSGISGTATLTTFLPGYPRPVFTGLAVDSLNRILVSGGLFYERSSSVDRDSWASSGVAGRLTAGGVPDATFGGAGVTSAWSGSPSGKSRQEFLEGTTRIVPGPGSSVTLAGRGPGPSGFTFTTSRIDGGSMKLPSCGGLPVDFIGTQGRDRILPYQAVVLTLSGDDNVKSIGNSTVCSGPGDDIVSQRSEPGRLFGGPGNDTLKGGPNDDSISGGAGDDRITGGAWIDRLSGGSGKDIISGGNRDDQIRGGAGTDRLYGGTGRDQLYGGPGRDLLEPGRSGPTLTDYRQTSTAIDLLLTRSGRDEAKASMRIQLKCDDEKRWTSVRMKPIEVDPETGKFRFRSDPGWRFWQNGSVILIEDIDGRFTRTKVSGRLRIYESYDFDYEPACFTGSSKEDNWIRFSAAAEPKPRQFARQ